MWYRSHMSEPAKTRQSPAERVTQVRNGDLVTLFLAHVGVTDPGDVTQEHRASLRALRDRGFIALSEDPRPSNSGPGAARPRIELLDAGRRVVLGDIDRALALAIHQHVREQSAWRRK